MGGYASPLPTSSEASGCGAPPWRAEAQGSELTIPGHLPLTILLDRRESLYPASAAAVWVPFLSHIRASLLLLGACGLAPLSKTGGNQERA